MKWIPFLVKHCLSVRKKIPYIPSIIKEKNFSFLDINYKIKQVENRLVSLISKPNTHHSVLNKINNLTYIHDTLSPLINNNSMQDYNSIKILLFYELLIDIDTSKILDIISNSDIHDNLLLSSNPHLLNTNQ